MATLQNAIDQAKANPNGSYARVLQRRIEAGEFDQQAYAEGIDLTGKSSTFQATTTPPEPTAQERVQSTLGDTARSANNGVLGSVFDNIKSRAQSVHNFQSGALDAFSAPGRTIQRGLSSAVDALTGSEGFGAPGDREQRLSTIGADVDATSTKVGEFAGEAGTFAAPGGAAAKVLANAPRAAQVAGQALTSFIVESAIDGDVDESSFAAGGVDVGIGILAGFAGFGGRVARGLAGGLTGTGSDVIDTAVSRPGATFAAVGDGTTGTVKELATNIRQGVKDLSKRAGQEYENLVRSAGVEKFSKSSVVQNVENSLVDLADASVEKGKLVLKNTPFDDSEVKRLGNLHNVVRDWTDLTPQGVNELARRISRFRRGSEASASVDIVVDGVRRNLRDSLGKQSPEIKDALEQFSSKADMLDEIESIVKTKGAFDSREGVRKTATSLQQLFNTNKEFARESIEELEKELGVDILGTIAGQQLSGPITKTSSSLGGAVQAGIEAVSRPIVRNAAPAAGAVDQFLSGIPGLSEAAKSSIKAIIDGSIGESSN